MSQVLKSVFVLDKFPRGSEPTPYVQEILCGACDAGWGIAVTPELPTNSFFGIPGSYKYGPLTEHSVSRSYGALILCVDTIAVSNHLDIPGVCLFQESDRPNLPVAIVHSEPLLDEVVLGQADRLMPAKPVDRLRASVANWLITDAAIV